MRVGKLVLIVTAMLLVAGCNSDDALSPPVGFAHAAATRSCGPADGPAVAIYLAPAAIATLEPATPYIRIDVWKAADALVGTWSLSATSAHGAASRFQDSLGSIESATGGTVVVSAVGSDSTITGSVDLQFPSSGRVHGAFSARWISRTFLCG
jgi:ABC-type Fe3+-hydroxamate transport system substrate-binding protein